MQQPETMSTTEPPVVTSSGVEVVGSDRYYRDAKGCLIPENLVPAKDRLVDDVVRKIVGYADDISAQVARFKGHTFDDVNTTLDLIADKYGAKLGGSKGNVTLMSIDGTLKVQVAVADQLTFGPELQAAKSLIDECIASWSEGSRDEIRALVNHAFQVDREGKINRTAIFQLRRVQIEDERWQQAMTAIGDAIRVVGSKEYVRFYKRSSATDGWKAVTVDLASA
ncbi:DUF3164 family protein [Microvirga terricola]|nr:DUF3164 family protein [Microvirga terricola]